MKTKDELIAIKKANKAMYIFIDNRYENSYICLYSDYQKYLVEKAAAGKISYVKETLESVCTKDTADWTLAQLENEYELSLDILD